MKFKIALLTLGAMMTTSLAIAQSPSKQDGFQTARYLKGYQCMQAGKAWTDADFNRWVANGRLPNDPSVPQNPPVYASSDLNAKQLGFEGNVALVDMHHPVVNNRRPVIWTSGKIVWMNVSDLSPYKVVSDPHAKCYPVQLKNGRYGFVDTPPK